MITVAALLLLACALPGPALGQSAAPADADRRMEVMEESKRVVIRFLTDSDFPPFNFLDEEGALAGFNIDLARAICTDLAVSCDIKARPWEDLFAGLKSGNADAVIAAHKVTAEALTEVAFTDRYFHAPGRFAARTGETETDISPPGLYGRRIAVARGTAHEAYLKAFFRDSPLALYENADLAREALASGQVDFLFDDGISLAFWLNGTASRQCCILKGGPFLEPRYFGDGIAIAVAKHDGQMRMMINTALQRLRASGQFEELVQRYFPFRIY
jgi:polar amino acid transport system substrate-binding protein